MINDQVQTRPAKILLTKIGLDGHDRGVQVVAQGLAKNTLARVSARTDLKSVNRNCHTDSAPCVATIVKSVHDSFTPCLTPALRPIFSSFWHCCP